MKKELCVNESIFKDIETAFNSGKQVTMRLSSGYNGILETMNLIAIYSHTMHEYGFTKERKITLRTMDGKTETDVLFIDLYKYEFSIYGDNEKTGRETKVFLKKNNDQSKFKEICDLAYKATLDGKLKIRMMTSAFIQFNLSNGTNIHYISESSSDKEYKDAVNEINNIYFEEFVIDEEKDLLKIKEEDTGTLKNDSEFNVGGITGDDNNTQVLINFPTGNFYWATIEILKGATIKQKKVD